MRIYIVGCGGIASYAVPVLMKTLQYGDLGISDVTLWDKDIIEERNLERQAFEPNRVGSSKAKTMARQYSSYSIVNVDAKVDWFTSGTIIDHESLVFCFADNHAARRSVLEAVDLGLGCAAIIAGNGTTNADAYYYTRRSKGLRSDPRIMFPELETSTAGDPTAHCNSEETLTATGGQSAIANFKAAQFALQLFTAYYLIEGLEDVRDDCPIYIGGNFSKTVTKTYRELNNQG